MVEGHVEMLTVEMGWMSEAKIQHSKVVDREIDAASETKITFLCWVLSVLAARSLRER